MDNQLNPMPSPASEKADSRQAARSLGKLLRQMQEYDTFLKALRAVNTDAMVQKLTVQMRAHQNALQWGRDGDGQHAVELARLEQEIEALPVVQEYRQAEAQIRRIFLAVDEIISREAGVAFAANARRSGCCG